MSEPSVWWEIQVSDLEQARAFYGDVFGWTFQSFGDDFAIAVAGDKMIGGLDASKAGKDPSGRHVRIYFATDDLEATLAKVEKAGGTVLVPRSVIGEEYGWFATFADPSGVEIGLTSDQPAA